MAGRGGLAMLAALLGLWPGMASAGMAVALGAPWDGKLVPPDQMRPYRGGNGATPPMSVSGLPEGTVRLEVEFNDHSYVDMAFRGGHGVIGFATSGPTAELPAVPGMTAELGAGIWVVSPGRGRGNYATPGYMPPCSGGRGHMYAAKLKAMAADGTELESVTIEIGVY